MVVERQILFVYDPCQSGMKFFHFFQKPALKFIKLTCSRCGGSGFA